MKKSLFLSFTAALLLTSCVSVREVANLNIVSTRNVSFESGTKYARIATYAGESNSEIKKSRATSIEDAVNATVRHYPGGEFMTNVKVWAITKGKKLYFAVSGDIFGFINDKGEVDRSYRGFAVGDRVIWEESPGIYYQGTIQTLVDDESCFIKREDGKIVKEKYTKLSK